MGHAPYVLVLDSRDQEISAKDVVIVTANIGDYINKINNKL